MKNSVVLMVSSLMCLAGSPREHIPAGSARNFVGQEQTVCGTVSEVVKKPYGSFINMGNHYIHPRNGKPLLVPDFTMVLWERNRNRLEIDPTLEFGGKEVCVYGLITRYSWRRTWHHVEVPQIELTSIDQYTVGGKEND
jgi:hypothetical protein